jgi:hypothetical protein
MWYHNFETYILSLVFVTRKFDLCIYFKEEGGCFIYVLLYFNDMLLIGNSMDVIKEVKNYLSSKLDMQDIDATNFILGMHIKRDRATRNIWLNQTKYIETVLKQFKMQDCKMVKVPIPMGARLVAE